MTILIPGTIEKRSWGKQHPFLSEFALIMDSSSIQYNALLLEYVNVAQEIKSFFRKWRVICHFQINFSVSEV